MQLQLEHFDLSCRFVGILLKIVESAALQLCLKPLKKWSEAKPAEATWAKAGRSKALKRVGIDMSLFIHKTSKDACSTLRACPA